MMGSGVEGGQILGSYPDNLTDDGELSVGRCRMIPTTSWDAVFLPISSGLVWMQLIWMEFVQTGIVSQPHTLHMLRTCLR
jgi:hypothetical protein